MHSFLITNINHQISNSPDTLVISPDPPAGGSIGIEEIRDVQQFLSRKPLAGQNSVYIMNAERLTLPAQNALLKTLEEPPGNSLIYLITSSPDVLLPTVLSRVQLITSSEPRLDVDIQGVGDLIERISSTPKPERILIVDELNFNRDTALEFLTKLEHWLHKNLKPFNYRSIDQTRKYLKANVNVKLAMDYLFLNLIY